MVVLLQGGEQLGSHQGRTQAAQLAAAAAAVAALAAAAALLLLLLLLQGAVLPFRIRLGGVVGGTEPAVRHPAAAARGDADAGAALHMRGELLLLLLLGVEEPPGCCC